MWSRWGAAVALAAGIVLLSAPAAHAAHAEDPVDLGGAYVLDTVGAISGDESRVQSALDSLYDRASIQLFVVYVDGFTNPSDSVAWADAVAVDNNLGRDDLLLAVAVEDRQYALSVDQAFPLSDAQLDDVENTIEDSLRNDAWADAAVNGAQALEAAATGVVGPNVPEDPQDDGETVGLSPVVPIVGGVAVVGIGVFVVSRIRKRSKDGTVTAVPEQMTQQELDRRAGSLLVQLDDSLKTSEQELGFAVAQFGDAATADFTATLQSARAKVAQAFTLKQRLDDAEADSDADKRAWTTQIIELCEAADAELDAQADAFDELRQLEKNAPQELVEVRAAMTAAAERKTAAESGLKALRAAYSAEAVASVSDNIPQAEKLLDFATSAATKADEAIAAGKASDAAIAVRTAQASVGQATTLFDAIDSLGTDLAAASEKLAAAVADTTQDVAAAKALAAQGGSAATLSPAIATAEAALAAAAKAGKDPIAGLAPLETANSSLDQVFATAKEQVERAAQANSRLSAELAGAQAQVSSAAEYIETRRGGIGESARTRISEAQRHLAEATALTASDPVAALAQAQQATAMAASALQLARNDVSSFEARESAVSYGGSGYSGSDGADLGGILGDWLFGGGGGGSSSSGGWFSGGGGSSSRSSRRSSWGGSSSRSSRSGSFGGSSRSSSRSSGGGRSRGGRF